MVGYTGSVRDLYLILKMLIKCVETGQGKIVKPLFETVECLSKTLKQRTLKSCVLKREGYRSDIFQIEII